MRFKKNKKTTNIEMGNLYDMNKSIIENNIPPMTKEEIEKSKTIIADYVFYKKNQYYMLLCNDRKDYTIFNISKENHIIEAGRILVDECLSNRGKIKSIALTETEDAVEIWLSIEGESYCYYFFAYDLGVIEC